MADVPAGLDSFLANSPAPVSNSNTPAGLDDFIGESQPSEHGLLGDIYDLNKKAIHTLAKGNVGFAKVADILVNTPEGQKVLPYVGGMARTGIAGIADKIKGAVTGEPDSITDKDYSDAASGNAPGGNELLEKLGVPSGGSVNIPGGKTLVGHDVNMSARDVAGAAFTGATDPTAAIIDSVGSPSPSIAANIAKKTADDFAAKSAELERVQGIINNIVSDHALGNPDLVSQKAAAGLGMGSVIDGNPEASTIESVVGDSGHINGTLSDTIVSDINQSKTAAETAGVLEKTFGLKKNINEIESAAKEIGAPLTSGMRSANPWVQRFEDSLVNGAPTFAGIQKAKTYAAGYEAAEKAVTDIVGEPEAQGGLSKAQFGQAMEKSLSSRIAEENAPISQIYTEVKQDTPSIPVPKKALSNIADEIEASGAAQVDPKAQALVKMLRDGSEKEIFQTVDGVKNLRKFISDSLSVTPSFNEQSTLAEIQDGLKGLEESTIKSHAESMLDSHAEKLATATKAGQLDEMNIWSDKINRLQDLLAKKQEADKLYAPFITKVKTLAKYFGKKRISGAQGAIDFITQELTSEKLANKVGQKGNSEFTKFFAENFPEENELLKQYQKAQLREASINERTGDFNSRLFLKKTIGKNGLEPEQLANLFTKDELKKLNAAQTYLRSIPEDFNPSHTSHAEALKRFFDKPGGAAVANVIGYGMDAFINTIMKIAPEARPDPIAAGQMLAEKFNKLSAIQKMTQKTDEAISSGAKSIFGTAAKSAVLDTLTTKGSSYNDKAKRISELAMNADAMGQHLQNHTSAIESAAPNVAQSFQHSLVASVNYLNNKLPKAPPQMMLSHKWEPSDLQKQKFNTYYQAVNNPVSVLKQVKAGTLTNEAMEAIDATHPALLQEMRQKVLSFMDTEKAMKLPYSVKLSLSKFLGEPLDSSMLPTVAMANQASFMANNSQPQGNQPKEKSTQTGLSKLQLSKRSKTETQDLEGNET